MRPVRCLSFALAALTVCSLASRQASGATIVAAGNFTADNTAVTLSFTAPSAQSYNFYTTSYGNGGFVPNLTLFNGAGNVVTFDGADGTCSATSKVDAATKMCDDASFTQLLSAGAYTLYLTEFPNVANGPNLSNGFSFSSSPTVTGDFCGVSGGMFLQTDTATCVQRSANYSVSENVIATTPEPATWALMLPAFAGLFFLDQRKRQQA